MTTLRKLIQKDRRESGQVLVVATAFLFLTLAVAAMILDGGFFLKARRDTQNTADAAALAGAQHLPDDPVAAEDAALAWASQNGWTDGVDGTIVTVVIPYEGTPRKIEVFVEGHARGSLFFDALMSVKSRAVAEVVVTDTGPGGGGVPGDPGVTPLAPAPVGDCGSDNAVVDGRVMPGEGYEKFADLVGESSTHFGEAFFACDSGYYYFALRMNGASTGGGVANENVYQCYAGTTGDVQINGTTIKKLKGTITSVGSSSFTMDAAGETWTVNIDGNTAIVVDNNPATIGDLTPGQEVDVRGNVVGPNQALATQVKAKAAFLIGGCGGAFSPTYHADYDTGWVQSPKGTHTFKDLLKSDRARFQVACGNAPVHDFVLDYLHEDGSGWASDTNFDGSVIVEGPAESSSSMAFNLNNPSITNWGDDPGEDPLIQSPPFSGPGSYPDYDSQYDGWVWEMLYEFKVPRSAYDGCPGVFFGLPPVSGGSGPVGGMHSSPAKNDEGVFVGVGTKTIEILLVE